jgi:response regulator of citrate/malate metabolism
MSTRTLVVEDDPLLAQAHAAYVERVPGFVVAGIVHGGVEALNRVGRGGIDLILLDFYLPDIGGLEVCRALRARGQMVDIIAVTSARDLSVVRDAISLGVGQYLLKPFTFAAFADRLRRYTEYCHLITIEGAATAQQDVDRALATLRSPIRLQLPKGLSEDTMGIVLTVLQGSAHGVTAAELADAVGISRVTARRYLEHLAAHRMVLSSPRYGGAGRPERHYRWNRSVHI